MTPTRQMVMRRARRPNEASMPSPSLRDGGARPSSAVSGSRGGCPPRLPQNRTYAGRIRLFGTAGYDPRRPVCRPGIISIEPVAARRERRSVGALGSVGRPERSAHAWRSTRCAGRGRPRACGSAPTRTCVPPHALSFDAQLDETPGDRVLRFQWRRMIARSRHLM
jgi:hypothetical protein